MSLKRHLGGQRSGYYRMIFGVRAFRDTKPAKPFSIEILGRNLVMPPRADVSINVLATSQPVTHPPLTQPNLDDDTDSLFERFPPTKTPPAPCAHSITSLLAQARQQAPTLENSFQRVTPLP